MAQVCCQWPLIMLSGAAVDFSLGFVIHHGSWCLSKKATLVQAFYDEKPGSNSTFTKAKWLSLQIPSWYKLHWHSSHSLYMTWENQGQRKMEYGKMWRCGKVFAHLPNYMHTQMCLFSKSTQSNVEGYIIRVLSEMQASSSIGWCDPLEELINQVHPCENLRKLSGGKFRETWMKCNLIRFRNFGARNWQKCGPGVNGVICLICVISLLPEAAEKPEPRIAVVCQFWVCTQPSLSSAQSARSRQMLSQAM